MAKAWTKLKKTEKIALQSSGINNKEQRQNLGDRKEGVLEDAMTYYEEEMYYLVQDAKREFGY